jgi:hypothetical protein
VVAAASVEGGDVEGGEVTGGEVGKVLGGFVVGVVVEGRVVVDGDLSFDPPLVATSTKMITAITTAAPTPMAIHMPRLFFCGR